MAFPSESTPIVNDSICSWANLTVHVAGDRVVGLQKCMWKHSSKRKPIRGRGRKVIGYTDPIYEAESSIELLLADSIYLKGLLVGIAGKGFMDQVFQATIKYDVTGFGLVTIGLKDCFLQESSSDASAGSDDAIVVPHPLTVREIIENGLSAVNDAT